LAPVAKLAVDGAFGNVALAALFGCRAILASMLGLATLDAVPFLDTTAAVNIAGFPLAPFRHLAVDGTVVVIARALLCQVRTTNGALA
jgi:hypothetical protein